MELIDTKKRNLRSKSTVRNSPILEKLKTQTQTETFGLFFGAYVIVENIDFLRNYFDKDDWIAVKSLVKIYKDKFVCKLVLEPAGKDSIKCKT